jgi:hypothetical protein
MKLTLTAFYKLLIHDMYVVLFRETRSIQGKKISLYYTGCLKIQSVVGHHFRSPNMEIKKKSRLPHKDTLV